PFVRWMRPLWPSSGGRTSAIWPISGSGSGLRGRGVSSASWVSADGLGCELGAAMDVELGEDGGHMGLDRRPRDEHSLADLGVGKPLGRELGDPGLGRGERRPAAARAPPRAARSARPLEGVVDAELGPLDARDLVGVIAERLVEPPVNGSPVVL